MSDDPLFSPWSIGSAETLCDGANVAIVLGLGDNTAFWALGSLTTASFLAATRSDATRANMLLFTDKEPARAAELLELNHGAADRARVRISNFNLTELRLRLSLPSTRQLGGGDGGWVRFALLAAFVSRHCSAARAIFNFDLRDVLFQTTPFRLAAPGHALTSFAEGTPVTSASWNGRIILPYLDDREWQGEVNSSTIANRATFRYMIHQRLPAVNSGAMFGSPAAFVEHALLLNDFLMRRRSCREGGALHGVDQAVHMLLVYATLHWQKHVEHAADRGDASTSTSAPPHVLYHPLAPLRASDTRIATLARTLTYGAGAASTSDDGTSRSWLEQSVLGTREELVYNVVDLPVNACTPAIALGLVAQSSHTKPQDELYGVDSQSGLIKSTKCGRPFAFVHQYNRANSKVQLDLACHFAGSCGGINASMRRYASHRVHSRLCVLEQWAARFGTICPTASAAHLCSSYERSQPIEGFAYSGHTGEHVKAVAVVLNGGRCASA